MHKNEPEKAEKAFISSIEMLRKLNNKFYLGQAVYQYGKMLMEKGKRKKAIKILEEAMKIFEELDSGIWISRTRDVMESAGIT